MVECKSFLDSPGVDCAAFNGTNQRGASRYKMFCDDTLRRVVLGRLEQQFVSSGFCAPTPTVRLCLAAGKIKRRAGGEAWLRQHFEERGWILLGPEAIRKELESLRDLGYENSVVAIVAKLLLRASPPGPSILGGADDPA